MIHGNEADLNIDSADADGLTAAERAELDAEAAEAAKNTEQKQPAKAELEPQSEPEKHDATAEALQTLAQQQARTADVLAAVASKVLPEQQQGAPKPEPAKEPDWDALRAELRAKHSDGEMDDDEYEDAREALLEQRAEWKAEQRVEARFQQQRQADQTASWDRSLNSFLGNPANEKFLADPAHTAVFNMNLSAICKESPGASYDTMLAEALARTQAKFGVAQDAAQGAKAAIDKAVAERRAAAQNVPPDLSRAPQAGSASMVRAEKFQSLDDLDIDSLEDRIARMSESELDEYLADAPGGLRDNPRAA